MPNSHDWEKIYEYIADCAHLNGITSAKQLAEKAGVDESVVSKLKYGKYKNPSFATIKALCDAAGAELNVVGDLSLLEERKITEISELDGEELRIKYEVLRVEVDKYKKAAEVATRAARARFKFIIFLTIFSTILIVGIISFLLYDNLHPDIGWFRTASGDWIRLMYGSTYL